MTRCNLDFSEPCFTQPLCQTFGGKSRSCQAEVQLERDRETHSLWLGPAQARDSFLLDRRVLDHLAAPAVPKTYQAVKHHSPKIVVVN